MLYYLVAVLLLAHAVYWGAGLALLILPREWRRGWWIFAAPLGWALQSAVVWAGAHLPWRGTDVYALATEALPLILLGGAWWRRKLATVGQGWAGLAAALTLGGLLLLWPMAQRGGWTLTSSSLGSCDHADYAAGARVLKEFSRSDQVGFMNLPEVTRIGSVDRFFDYWLRLNHFSPSAIIAHNAAVFSLAPYQLISVTAAVFWLGTIPLLLPLARALGWRRRARVFVVVLFAVSPLGGYAVHQAALGQMLAAQGIAMLTLVTAALARPGRRIPLRFVPFALAGFWLLAGSYNFILVIALAPALAGLGLEAIAQRRWRSLRDACVVLGVALIACGVIFFERFAGVAERFRLFETYDFGWPVPVLTPEGWLGGVRDAHLTPWPEGMRLALLLVALAALAAGLRWQWRRQRPAVWRTVGWLVTVAGGWAVLAWESRTRANASYDAYKVVMVFLPLLLPALLLGFGAVPARGWRWAWIAAIGWIGFAGVGAIDLARRMANPPLRVDRSMVELRRLESDPRFESYNLRIDQFWSRLWANVWLLRRAHYFPTHTYEARLNTELKGAWDLRDSLLRSLPADPGDSLVLNFRYHVVRADAPGRVGLAFGDSWYARERAGDARWRWAAAGLAVIQVDNPARQALRVSLAIRLRAIGPTVIYADLGGNEIGRTRVDREWSTWEIPEVLVAPGRSTLTLRTTAPPQRGGPNDERLLTFALGGLTMRSWP